VETILARKAYQQTISIKQLMLFVGSLLGDGYLDKTTRGYAMRIHHCFAQSEYVEYKYSFVENLVNSKPKRSKNAYYFRTVSHPFFITLRKAFYLNRVKIIPKDFLLENFDAFALAIWIMDDGAKDKNQLRINTQCFSLDENKWLSEFLQAKFGIRTSINIDKGKYRLRIKEASMQLLRSLILPYMIPSMLYKLSL